MLPHSGNVFANVTVVRFDTGYGNKSVFVTIGLFTIVQITRNVQMLIPAYDFCIPGKECVTTSDNPCEVIPQNRFSNG